MAIVSKVEKITPEIATKILEESKDIRNRNVRDSHVDWLASQMKAGKWVLNGEAIILDDEGQLIDGQHRMWAVVNSGVTIESLVTRGVERKGFATIDTGAARTLANVLGIVGEKNAAAVASALSWTFRWEHGKMLTNSKELGFSHQVGLNMMRKYPEIQESAELIYSLRGRSEIIKRMSPSVLIFLHHRFSAHSKEKALEFFETLGDLRFDSEGTATRTLRNQILRLSAEGNPGGVSRARELMAICVKAWTDFLAGKRPAKSYSWRRMGEYPEDFPRFPGEKESRGKSLRITRKYKFKKAAGE